MSQELFPTDSTTFETTFNQFKRGKLVQLKKRKTAENGQKSLSL